MNWKATLALLLIAGALYAFFDLYENKRPGTREVADNASRVFALDRSQIDGLVVTNHDIKLDLRREGPHWAMKVPIADRADQTVIDELMTNLEMMRKDETMPVAKNKLQDYGLQTPKLRVQVIAHGGSPTDLIFGNDTAIDGKSYLQLGGTDNVLVVNDELKKVLQKDVNAWRDHRLTDLAATDVTKLTIKNAAGDIELQRTGEHWKLVKPLAARADDQKVNDLVAQATNLSIDSFVGDDKANAATYGLAEPRGVITLSTAADPKGIELMLGGNPPAPAETPKPAVPAAGPAVPPKAPETVYARLPARQSIYTVPKSIEAFLTVKPNDLRDMSLVRLNADQLDRIKIMPAAGTPFTLGRKDKSWTLLAPANGPVIDSATAETLIQTLQQATTKFVADSAADLAKYGLDHPVLQVAFSSFASENTAESNAGEKPLATLSFGKAEEGSVYARLEEEPFIVSISKGVFDEIPADVLAWQPRAIFQADADKVRTLTQQAKGRAEVAATRPRKVRGR